MKYAGRRGTFASAVCSEEDCADGFKFISVGFSQSITSVKTARFCHFLIKIQPYGRSCLFSDAGLGVVRGIGKF